MPFEFDPNKSAINKDKHGIDFDEAQAIWQDEGRVNGLTRYVGESRHLATGRIGNRIWTAVFTLREDRIRLISVRRTRDDEVKRYEDHNG